jgi:hypothetical protein
MTLDGLIMKPGGEFFPRWQKLTPPRDQRGPANDNTTGKFASVVKQSAGNQECGTPHATVRCKIVARFHLCKSNNGLI